MRIVGVPLAYVLATREFRGKAVADVAVMLPLVLPPVVTGYYLLLLIGKSGLLGNVTQALTGTAVGLTFTWEAAVIASFAIALPLAVTRRALGHRSGRSGARRRVAHPRAEVSSRRRSFVVLPLAARGIIAGLALSFARALGEFGATIMVAGNIPGRTNTMALEIYNAVVYGDWRTASVLVVVFTVVSAGFLLLAQSADAGGGRGERRQRQPAQELPGFDLDVGWTVRDGFTVLFGYSGAGKSLTLVARSPARCVPTTAASRSAIETLFDSAAGIWVPPQQPADRLRRRRARSSSRT